MATAEKFSGTWVLVESDNFDRYLKQVAKNIKPTLTYSVDNDKWKIISESYFKKHVWEFELGKEFNDTTPDGRQVKSKFFLEGDKLIQIENPIKAGDKSSRFERYIDEQDQLIIYLSKKGAPGFEPGTSRSAVECSATELYPLW